MRAALIPLLLAALLGGGLAGAIVSRFTAPARAAADATSPAPAVREGDDALLARLVALEEQNLALEKELEGMTMTPPPLEPPARVPVAAGSYVALETFEAFRAEVNDALAGLGAAPAETEVFKDQVADVLTAIRKEETVEKVRGYQEKRRERLDEDVRDLTDRLELSSYQAGEMRTAILAQYEREDEQRRLWEEGVDDAVLAERKRLDGESFNTDLSVFLSEDQVGDFWRIVFGGDDDEKE